LSAFLCALCVKALLLLFLLRLSTVNCQLSAFSTGEYQSTLVSHCRRNKRRHAPRNLLNNRFCCPFGNIGHSAPICSSGSHPAPLPLREFNLWPRLRSGLFLLRHVSSSLLRAPLRQSL